MNLTERIITYLGCECEILGNAESVSFITKKYVELLTRGKTEGFFPLVIVPNDLMCDLFDAALSNYAGKGARINPAMETSYEEIDVNKFLNNRIKEALPEALDMDYDIMGTFIEVSPAGSFSSLIDYEAGRPYETIIIAKIPIDKPWELAAWVPMGGWNECPSPEEQVAVFKYWHEKYGAIPAVVHGDIWEMYVENPPETNDDAVALALEQFGFCADIVWQGVEKINILASTLVNSKFWYFWWD